MYSSKARLVRGLGAVTLAALVWSGCSPADDLKKAPPLESAAEGVRSVKVEPVGKRAVADSDEQVADVLPYVQLDVVLKADGDVEQVFKKRGELVQEGEPILKLDTSDMVLQQRKNQIGVKSAEAQLLKAKQDLQDTKTELHNNIKKLEQQLSDATKQYSKSQNEYDKGLITKIQLQQAETTVSGLQLDISNMKQKLDTMNQTNSLSSLEVQLESSQLAVQEADRALQNYTVTAPISGMITDLPVERGMTLQRGSKAVQLQQLDPVKIKAELNDFSLPLVQGKGEISFYVPGQPDRWKGKVTYLSSVSSGASKTYSLELELSNQDGKLKPGMRVQLLLHGEKAPEVVAVPTASIVREGNETFVFVMNGETVEKRIVTLGKIKEPYQEVMSGLKEGELLVISGQFQLKDKEKVQLEKEGQS
jgi:HlyD family secretion protein